jgi:Tol biopolymer transport system component/DNA-binding winged helix-turn-helix (wHTH) protein
MSVEYRKPFRAGEWVVLPELNSLRKGSSKERRVEPKVMKVLLVLAAQPDHVVSKEDLIAAVWPDTFVGDDVLTRCISVLRRVTQDDAYAPKFIQTIPKAGYRLVAEIQELPEAEDPRVEDSLATVGALVSDPSTPRLQSQPPSHDGALRVFRSRFATAVVVTLVAIGVLSAWAWRRHSRTSLREGNFVTLPFTFLVGEQLQPAFSPDGSTIAFAAVSEDGATRHLYVKKIGGETSKQITFGQGDDFSPSWSPDGTRIAYLSDGPDGLGLYVLMLASPEPRRLIIPQQETHWDEGALSWSPDGTSLLFPDHAGSSSNSSIYRLDLATLQVRSVTTPPQGWEGDLTPAYSPDGKYFAFTRASETAVRDIYYVSLKDGSLHQLTHHLGNVDSITWNADSSAVVFASNLGGKSALWQFGLNSRTPERLPFGTEDAFQPAVNARTGRLAYTQGSSTWKLLSLKPSTDNASSQTVLSSTAQDSAPSLSPDGDSLAFQTQRSGVQEIWLANSDGSNLRQLTHQGGPLTGSPSYSHSGDRILFDSRVDGHSHIFAVTTSGGTPHQLTFGNVNDITPRWSHDDSMVYFRSNRGGRWQIWRAPIASGAAQAVTKDDGIVPQESPDGKWVYYARGGEPGIWRTPTSGGAETQILTQPASTYWGYWQLTSAGLYSLSLSDGPPQVRVFDPTTGKDKLFRKLNATIPPYAGLTASSDGRDIIITSEAQSESHITLVESTSATGNTSR